MSRHLVTGGAGFIGSALVHRLLQEGHEVTVLDRMSRGKSARLPEHPNLRIIKGDITKFGDVISAVWDANTIWHLAYVQGTQTFYADPKDVIDVALIGIMNVLKACEQECRPPELILVSSSEAYQTPPEGMFPTDETVPLSVPDVTNPRYSYGGGKIASELATLAYSQAGVLSRAIIVRPHNVYGPDMGHEHVIPEFCERLFNLPAISVPEFPIQGTGYETRSFCYIGDCIDGLMVAYEHGKDREVYHLGNPDEEYQIHLLATLMAEFLGERIEVVPGKLPEGSPTRRLPSIDKLAALGFEPKVELPVGLAATIPWYMEHFAARLAA